MNENLAAVRIGRRTIAVTIFLGLHMEHVEVIRLSSDIESALRRVPAIVQRLLDQFEVTTVALESSPIHSERRTAKLQEALVAQLRAGAIAIWPVAFVDLCRHFSLVPVRARHALRQIASKIFPGLAGNSRSSLDWDAALLGLHVQIERILSVIPAEWSNTPAMKAAGLHQNSNADLSSAASAA
jgi:hypothetical protein